MPMAHAAGIEERSGGVDGSTANAAQNLWGTRRDEKLAAKCHNATMSRDAIRPVRPVGYQLN